MKKQAIEEVSERTSKIIWQKQGAWNSKKNRCGKYWKKYLPCRQPVVVPKRTQEVTDFWNQNWQRWEFYITINDSKSDNIAFFLWCKHQSVI